MTSKGVTLSFDHLAKSKGLRRAGELLTGSRRKKLDAAATRFGEHASNLDEAGERSKIRLRAMKALNVQQPGLKEQVTRHGKERYAKADTARAASEVLKGESKSEGKTVLKARGAAAGATAITAGTVAKMHDSKTKKAAAEFFLRLKQAHPELVKNNPAEDFLEDYGSKEAAFGQQAAAFGQAGAKAFGAAALQGVAAAGASALVAGTVMGAQHVYQALTRERDFKKMMEANEDLHVMHQSDPRKFNLAFNSLRSMNADFAKDPFVAGSYMRAAAENPTGGSMLAERVYFPSQKNNAGSAGNRGSQAAAGSVHLPSFGGQREAHQELKTQLEAKELMARLHEHHGPRPGHDG